jgi:prevent-host-death family protein
VQSVGVRELKQRATQILRRVREEGETVEVTYRGRVVARIVPVQDAKKRAQVNNPTDEEIAAWFAQVERTAAEISAHWPEGVSAVDAVREQRREL